jgi:ribulose-phosphate 3-epimerase
MPDTVRAVDRLRAAAPVLSVGVLTANWLTLGDEIRLLENAGIPALHFDVMDGVFCPMLTFGPPVIKAIKTPLLKDVHLITAEPLDRVEAYVAAGADMITVHIEACQHPHRVLQALGRMSNANDPQRGLVRGVALNPGTPVEAVEPLLDEVEMVFLLAVNPGWGGQKFITTTIRRMEKLLGLIRNTSRDLLTGIDGGVTRDNVADIARMAPDIIITGSAVFDGKAPAQNAAFMLDAVKNARRG